MTFLDTSILVAAAQKQHSHHAQSATLLQAADRTNTACALHSLAEMYNILSGMPKPVRLPPSAAMAIVRQVRARVRLVALTESEYVATLDATSRVGLMGGIVFDALLMRCAQKAQATKIYTLNPGHFKLVLPELASSIFVP